jgi:hypothetical protein
MGAPEWIDVLPGAAFGLTCGRRDTFALEAHADCHIEQCVPLPLRQPQ